jgi:cytochrome c-type biogenesis protein CcmH/NrfG
LLWLGTGLAIGIGAVAGAAWWLLKIRRMPIGNAIGVVALAAWLVSMGVVWVAQKPSGARSELVRSMDSVAWPEKASSPLVPQAPVASQPAPGGAQVASVGSMIGGLEARLAAEPNDANGWVLLAQSYAYTADAEGAERAIRHAVELGVDEQALRERVDNAKRSAHPFGPPGAEPR